MTDKILNLYAGIGGNRKLWENVDVTAIERDPAVAEVYQKNFPDDTIIVTDAHQYLLNNFDGYDFIWSSPPCPTHSQIRKIHYDADPEKQGEIPPVFPDMKLYEEILFLEHYHKGRYVVENVRPYYKPLIQAQVLQRHLFWANYYISPFTVEADRITGGSGGSVPFWEEHFGFDLSGYEGEQSKATILTNCVHPKLGKHIYECSKMTTNSPEEW